MKIVFFVHCFFPSHFYGTETYTLELARCYQSWGHDVTVVSAIFQGEQPSSDLITHYKYAGIPVISIDKNRIPHSRVSETYYQVDMRPVLESVLRKLQPDVVHVTHLINHTAALLEVAKHLNIRTYATFTDFFGFCLNNKLEAADGELCRGPSSTRVNCVACHFKAAANSSSIDPFLRYAGTPRNAMWLASGINAIRRLPGLRGSRIDCVVDDIVCRPTVLAELYNTAYRAAVAPTSFLRSAYENNGIRVPMHNIWFGVDIERKPKPKRLRGHRPIIGFIGQIAQHKGPDLLIEAFKRLPKGAGELRVYGPFNQDQAYMSELRNMATDDISFLGTFPKERMHDVLECLDLLVIPSRWYENSPLVLLSALATHTPVVVSDVAGMTEFLENGRNGFAFERGNVDDLERVLVKLVSEPESLFELSTTTHFERTPERMARETFQIYDVA
ncbi:glycosyltransferase family 4 protein [Noviherbaspirillum massiliense]|uniref:glycosyltransferase family 4 protein n=1 Tax=Noviherbaspirillum massiliense TaxID=1465823 RepID=UPI00030C0AA8|nr:glycosyltransferase family 4 protein [Noviherbaspirillum massiliense]